MEEIINEEFFEEEYDEDGNFIEPKKKSYGVDYGAMAKALGKIKKADTVVAPPHINIAKKRFEADVENNRILYSLKGLTNVGDAEIEKIISGRPYASIEDFLKRCPIEIRSNISLIKSGAFDELEGKPREQIMREFIAKASNPRLKLNMQNFRALSESGVFPEELKFSVDLWNFNGYIRQSGLFRFNNGKLLLDDRAQNFMSKNYADFYAGGNLEENNMISIDEKEWKKVYDKGMLVAKNWIIKNQTEILEKFNKNLFDEMWDKYCGGDLSKWEMDSMSYYSDKHELDAANLAKYGIQTFSNLPEEPRIEYIFEVDDKKIPIYEITKIAGTCISKEKLKNTFTILTNDGSVVDIRLNNEHFAYYDKRISDMQDGTKKTMEDSWFSRGNKIMVVGFRRGDNFTPKRYARTPEQHRLYLITDIDEQGEMTFATERWGSE